MVFKLWKLVAQNQSVSMAMLLSKALDEDTSLSFPASDSSGILGLWQHHFNLCLIFIGPSLLPDVCLTFHGLLLLVSLFSHLLSRQLYQTRTYPNSIRYHLNFIICKGHISKLYHIPRYWGLGLQVSLGRHNLYYNNCN